MATLRQAINATNGHQRITDGTYTLVPVSVVTYDELTGYDIFVSDDGKMTYIGEAGLPAWIDVSHVQRIIGNAVKGNKWTWHER